MGRGEGKKISFAPPSALIAGHVKHKDFCLRLQTRQETFLFVISSPFYLHLTGADNKIVASKDIHPPLGTTIGIVITLV